MAAVFLLHSSGAPALPQSGLWIGVLQDGCLVTEQTLSGKVASSTSEYTV